MSAALFALFGVPLLIVYLYLDYRFNRAIMAGLWRGGKRLAAAYRRHRAQRRGSPTLGA
jgi:hypothetical protein